MEGLERGVRLRFSHRSLVTSKPWKSGDWCRLLVVWFIEELCEISSSGEKGKVRSWLVVDGGVLEYGGSSMDVDVEDIWEGLRRRNSFIFVYIYISFSFNFNFSFYKIWFGSRSVSCKYGNTTMGELMVSYIANDEFNISSFGA